jgi:hypothetical protein
MDTIKLWARNDDAVRLALAPRERNPANTPGASSRRPPTYSDRRPLARLERRRRGRPRPMQRNGPA